MKKDDVRRRKTLQELKKDGIIKIVKTYPNGVRIGGVLGHRKNIKRLGYMGQSWFPETWTDDDILVAGTHVVNSVDIKPGVKVFSEYNGVRIGVIFDDNGNPSTIFPDAVEQP